VVEAPHHHQQKGGLYHVRIHITLPPRLEVVVDRESHQNHAHEDVHVAVRDAFKAARRQLKNHARKARGMIKHHEAPSHGKIVKLFDEPAYGFIEAPDQTEIYFDYNAVISGDAEQLEIGSEVRFVQEDGDKGPQATSVQLVGRHHSLETK
jgi:cold shock CspA family protein